jgi:hypothetical protein
VAGSPSTPGPTLPTASSLNFAFGETVANLVKVQIIADIVGYYSSSWPEPPSRPPVEIAMPTTADNSVDLAYGRSAWPKVERRLARRSGWDCS